MKKDDTITHGWTPQRAWYYLSLLTCVTALVLFRFLSSPFQSWVAFLGLLGALALIVKGIISYRQVRVILEDTPTSKIRAASVGQAEFTGRVVPVELANAGTGAGTGAGAGAGTGAGLNQRVRSDTGMWRIEAAMAAKNEAAAFPEMTKKALPFYLEDETGRILVVPHGAEWVAITFDKKDRPPGKNRWLIHANSVITVIGHVKPVAANNPELGMMIGKGDSGRPFAIIAGSEGDARIKLAGRTIFFAGAGVLVALAVGIYTLVLL